MLRGITLAVDIETSCAMGCETDCKHALDFNRNNIDLVGVYGVAPSGSTVARTFRNITQFASFCQGLSNATIVGHGAKFDKKSLKAKGIDLEFHHDTQLMAVASTRKVPEWWLESYEKQRLEINKTIKGTHRKGSRHSLKTLAPYFLKVDPFWEDPTNHDDETYVLKDCEYTLRLYNFFTDTLSKEEKEFYTKRLLPWTNLLARAEYRGVQIDLPLLEEEDKRARTASEQARQELDKHWAPAYKAYYDLKVREVDESYNLKRVERWERMKSHLKTPERKSKLLAQYEGLKRKAIAKIEPLNLDSPAQLTWLLKNYLNLDIKRQDNDEDSTGRNVLERLANEGETDVKTFLEYRKQRKLVTAFFPSYRDMHYRGILHTNYNPSGTRTGRLSSDTPNLQQVPGHLHKLFRARPGYKFFCVDQAAIEARLIALYTEDPILYDVITSGRSIHDVNAKIFFGLECDEKDVKKEHPKERAVAKNCGFGLFYGAGWRRIQFTAMQAGIVLTEQKCREIYSNFKESYSTVFRYKRRFLDPLLSRGEIVYNLLGRPIRVDNPDDVHMKGFNRLIQSSASDLVWEGGNRIQRRFDAEGLDAHVSLFVHDEIVGEFAAEHSSEHIFNIVKQGLTGFTLRNSLGPIPLTIEGGIGEVWTH